MQHDTNSPFKIIVVGGGIAGLAIAHSLERAKRSGAVSDVTVVVFESRTEESSFQKYPINLSAPGRVALSAILSPESLQQLEQRSYTLDGGISTFTETLSHLFTFKRRADERRLFVHRWILHEALLEGVDVRRGKRVVRVKDDREDGAGKVEVVLHDGTVERGDLVIAADGIGSVTRSQLHPRHAKFPELPYLTVQFKLLTPPERLPIALSDSRAKMILGKNGTCLLLAPLPGSTVPALPHTDLNPFSDPSDVRPTLDALNEPTPGYIFAVFGCKVFPGWEDMSGQSWLGTIAKTLERDGTHPHIVKAIADDGVPQTVGAWRTLSADPKDPVPWRDGRFVFCGDAVHVMPSIAGAGGATALKDAEHLVNTLLSSCELGGSDGPLDALLPTFHAEMMNRAHGHIRDAHRKLAFSCQEGWGVYWRRALMRIMALIWPLANWMLNRGQEAAAKATESSEEQRRKVL